MKVNKYLVKAAEFEAGEHQQRVLAKLKAKPGNQGLVVAHGMGSGKTSTGLLVAKEVHDSDSEAHVVALTPASLRHNFHQEEDKHGIGVDKNRLTSISYDSAPNRIDEIVAKNPKVVLLDEGHKLRNTDTARYKAVQEILKRTNAKPVIFTGTPDYNKPADLRVMINLAAGKNVVPATEAEFENKFIGSRKVKPGFVGRLMGVEDGEVKFLKNTDELKKHINDHVDFYDGKTHKSEDFPSSHEEVVKSTMSPEQHRLYRYLENDLPAPVRWKVRLGLPLNKREAASLNSFSTGVRQISNSTAAHSKTGDSSSPKIDQIVADHIEGMNGDKNFRGIIYSNYLEAGLTPLSEELKKKGIDHAIYDGSLKDKEKQDLVDRYNNGELKTLLVSSSGSEGLNLKGTKMVQTMEPHFNKKKIDQVVARGIRFKSHEHLPEEERHVTVKHYHSVLPKGMFDSMLGRHIHSIDEYLHNMSSEKASLGEEMKNLSKNDAGHYKAASESSWKNPPPLTTSIAEKAFNPARYVGMAQQSLLPGGRGAILAKVEKMVINKAVTGNSDPLGKKT